MKNIGFVGLGHMGLPMASNLIKKGFNVTGYDLNPIALDAIKHIGGHPASTLNQCLNQKDIIITMLQTGQQVKSIYFEDDGSLKPFPSNTLLIDCSSIDVESARHFHRHAADQKIKALDAPVSGGVAAAQAGTLTFMVGGEFDTYNLAKPVLEAMGQTILHTGDAGSGMASKLCNNMILGSSMIAIAEAFLLAKNLGLSPSKLFEVVTHASGRCWVMEKYVPVPGVLPNVPAEHDYQPGFTAAMMLKDLILSQRSAENVGVKTPIAQRATELYQAFNEQDMGQLDFSAIIKLLES